MASRNNSRSNPRNQGGNKGSSRKKTAHPRMPKTKKINLDTVVKLITTILEYIKLMTQIVAYFTAILVFLTALVMLISAIVNGFSFSEIFQQSGSDTSTPDTDPTPPPARTATSVPKWTTNPSHMPPLAATQTVYTKTPFQLPMVTTTPIPPSSWTQTSPPIPTKIVEHTTTILAQTPLATTTFVATPTNTPTFTSTSTVPTLVMSDTPVDTPTVTQTQTPSLTNTATPSATVVLTSSPIPTVVTTPSPLEYSLSVTSHKDCKGWSVFAIASPIDTQIYYSPAQFGDWVKENTVRVTVTAQWSNGIVNIKEVKLHRPEDCEDATSTPIQTSTPEATSTPVRTPIQTAIITPLPTITPISTPPDDEDGEGCTPGYWKNHLESWEQTGYSSTNDFDAVFGVDFFNSKITLEQAVNMQGGGDGRLARHGTAALLNAAHLDVEYPLTVQQVIATIRAGDVDQLSEFNDFACPLE